MSINWVQFQQRLSIAKFLDRFGSENKCHGGDALA